MPNYNTKSIEGAPTIDGQSDERQLLDVVGLVVTTKIRSVVSSPELYNRPSASKHIEMSEGEDRSMSIGLARFRLGPPRETLAAGASPTGVSRLLLALPPSLHHLVPPDRCTLHPRTPLQVERRRLSGRQGDHHGDALWVPAESVNIGRSVVG